MPRKSYAMFPALRGGTLSDCGVDGHDNAIERMAKKILNFHFCLVLGLISDAKLQLKIGSN